MFVIALGIASYSRIAVGVTIGVAATVLLQRWYTRVAEKHRRTHTGVEGSDGDAGAGADVSSLAKSSAATNGRGGR